METEWKYGFIKHYKNNDNAFGLVWHSNYHHVDNPTFNHLSLDWFKHRVRIKLPMILQPFRIKHIAQSWTAQDIARIGRNYYYEVHPREYGIKLSGDGFLYVSLGAQTWDSTTTQKWSCFLPWTQWHFHRMSLYDTQGKLFWQQVGKDANGPGSFERLYHHEQQCPVVKFLIEDYDGEQIVVSTHIEEREWTFGTKWCKWLKYFRKNKVRRSLDIHFESEVGKDKGSWKGGTIGTGIDMLPDELHQQAFERFCEEDHRSKCGPYKIKLLHKID